MIKEIIKNNKTFLIIYSFLLLIGIGIIIIANNNYFMYKEPIAKIVSIENELISTEELKYGYTEDVYIQHIKAIIKNGEDKNEEITIENEYHQSQAYEQKYKNGDEIIVFLNKRNNQIINAYIEGINI